MKLVLLGPPGAGKGTLASLLKSTLDLLHISTGDLLREEMKNGTELGKEAKKFIEDGKLVPDELVTKLVENKFKTDKRINRGYMLDGFPRTVKQAEDLGAILAKVGKPLDYAINMEATLAVILKRLTGRRVCKKCGATYHMINRPPQKKDICDACGSELYQRADDNEATIKTRMDIYLKNTKPIIDYYKDEGILKTIDGDKESEDLQEELMKTFNEHGQLHQH